MKSTNGNTSKTNFEAGVVDYSSAERFYYDEGYVPAETDKTEDD